jgi:hypothetical protein
VGELVSYRGPNSARPPSERKTGLWLSSNARQALFIEELRGEIVVRRIDNLTKAQRRVRKHLLEIADQLLIDMEAEQDNPYALSALENTFNTWVAGANCLLREIATRELI